MKNDTQKQWVKDRLAFKGYITRNECLGNYISRLSAIIQDLELEGYEFETGYNKSIFGKDFVYKIKPKGQINLI